MPGRALATTKDFEKSSFFYSQCFHNQFLWLGIEF